MNGRAAGRFSDALYTRFAECVVRVPPLRDRREDIPELAQYFADLKCQERKLPRKVFDPYAMELLTQADYPGNLRDLRSLVQRAVVVAGQQSLIIMAEDVEHALCTGRWSGWG